MARQILLAVVVAVSLFTFKSFSIAKEQTLPSRDAAAASGTTLQVKVIAVEGSAQYRSADDQPWQAIQNGMMLSGNAEVRTGLKSAVRFVIEPDQIITVDRLTTIKILEAAQKGGKLTTRLGMKYGRTRYDIQAAGLEHDATISSPSQTLALTGTDMVVTDQRPFSAQVFRIEGRALFKNFRKANPIAFGTKGAYGRTVVSTEKDSPQSLSLTQSVIDPTIALARSEAEANLIAHLLSNGATVEYDFEKGIKVVRGGQPPTMDSELIPILPGRLNFVLRWTGNTDLNIAVFSPEQGQNLVYPLSGFDSIPSGGHIAFDHRGGPHGGVEIVSWPAGTVPAGRYLVGSAFISGQVTPASLDVFLDGNRLPIDNTPNGTVTTANFTAGPQPPGVGNAIGTVSITDDQAAAPQAASRKSPSKAKLSTSSKLTQAAALPRRK